MNPETQTLDQDAVNLSKAIRQVETGNRPVAGATGEVASRYQFLPGTWKRYAKEVLGDENAPINLENENKVAYTKIKAWKDQGYNPGQIASMWNAGEGRPDAYKQNWRKTDENGKVLFDTPAYAEKVATEYHKFKNENQQQTFNPKPFSNPTGAVNPGAVDYSGMMPKTPTTPESGSEGLGSQLIGRTKDLGEAVQKGVAGEINPLSSVLQVGGAIGGAVGDVVNAGLGLIPGFKAIEGFIGRGAQKFFQTDLGKNVATSLTNFQSQHPELAKDLEAGFNIITAVPILRGLGEVGNIAGNAAAKVLANKMKSIAVKDVEDAIVSSGIGGAKKIAKNPEAAKALVNSGAFGELEFKTAGGLTKYSTERAEPFLNNKISVVDQTKLQPILETVSSQQNFGQSLDYLKNLAVKAVKQDKDLMESGIGVQKAINQINARFEGWKMSYGNSIDLATENRLKIGTGKFTDWGKPEGSADKILYKTFQQNIEDVAKKNGFNEVNAINQEMASLIKAKELLSRLEGRTVKNKGIGHLAIKGLSTSVGAGIGSVLGGNTALGGLLGYGATGYVEGKLGGLTARQLAAKTLKKASNPSVNNYKKVGGLLGSALSQKSLNGTSSIIQGQPLLNR